MLRCLLNRRREWLQIELLPRHHVVKAGKMRGRAQPAQVGADDHHQRVIRAEPEPCQNVLRLSIESPSAAERLSPVRSRAQIDRSWASPDGHWRNHDSDATLGRHGVEDRRRVLLIIRFGPGIAKVTVRVIPFPPTVAVTVLPLLLHVVEL